MNSTRTRNARTGGRWWVLAATLLAASTAAAQTVRLAPAWKGDTLVSPPRNTWPTNGGNWYNQRYSPLAQIDRSNVGKLKGVWRARLGGSGVGTKYSGEAQPIVYGGIIYVVTGADDVFAISVDTGDILWKYEAKLDDKNDVVCCGWTSRGVGLGDGKLFVGQLDGKLVALEQKTGKVVWQTQAERWQDGYSITAAPLYYDGLVIVGVSGAEYGIRGRVKAFNAKTGAPAWTFHTVPAPGERGHDTWPQDNDSWKSGGGSVWQTPAVDPELGLLYFSTGNPGPDYSGGVRKGDNLFTASVVALEAKTGKYRWHFQQVHHDIWDYDGPSPVVLFDLQLNGMPRKGIAQPSKTGWVYILDRTNGTPLIGIDEQPVPQEPRQATAATQPIPRGDAFVPQSIGIAPEGLTLVNGGKIFTPFWTEQSVPIKPGFSGGANWPPSSYDPTTGYFYVCAQDRIGVFHTEDVAPQPVTGKRFVAGAFGSSSVPRLGVFAALDMHTNKLVWQQQWSDECYSGSTTTAGGLTFVGRNDGRLTALDSSNGAKLWEFQTGAGMNAPVSVFEHDSKQYVVAYSAGNLFAASPKGDSVWLFALDGALDPVPPPGAAMLLTLNAAAQGAADPVKGRQVYDTACVFCHGEQGEGGHGGGRPLTNAREPVFVVQTVTEGRKEMPAFAGALTPEQIRDVAAYVATKLPHGY